MYVGKVVWDGELIAKIVYDGKTFYIQNNFIRDILGLSSVLGERIISNNMKSGLLQKLVAQKLSTREIARQTNKSQTTIRYWLQKYSFETTATNGRPNRDKKQKFCLSCKMQLKTNPKSTNKFCDNRCQQEFQYHKYIAAWQSGKISGNRGKGRNLTISNHVKRFLKEKHGEKCSICGWTAVNPITKRVPITFDHKDGNPLNSREENLRILCPNCHSLTETYGALNRG